MNSDSSPQLGAEFMDDFYSECDEHLTSIRQSLVTLESSVDSAKPDQPALEKLFRSFHSLKGNSAIIGLRSAEELAHSAEDFLRELTREKRTLTSDGLDLLMSTAQRLEQIVACHREKKSAPEATELVADLKRLIGKPAETSAPIPSEPSKSSREKTDSNAAIDEARASGLSIWRFAFSPTRELDQRGVNVNSVRSRIGARGDIIQASPQVHPDGKVVFEFIAALKETPTNISAWEEDGITIHHHEAVAAAPRFEAPAGGSEAPEAATGSVAPSHIVRVDLSRLDELMRITGDMVIQRARLEDQINRVTERNPTADVRGLQEINIGLGRALRELRESIIRVRLVPVSEIFARMPFVVRDLSRETGKKVRLTLEGQATEIDKFLVERLKDPLLHLVRNSVSHGIENAEEREAAGKPAQATIFLRASTIGDSVLIEMGDDGRGIDVETVRRRAAEKNIPVPAVLSDTALLNLICLPGFSTRDEADRASGRGMGMAVVNNIVRELGGTLSLETEKNHGTKFSLRLPLTLAIADVFVLSAKDQTCAVPQSFVQEVLQMSNDQVRTINGAEVIPYRDGILPLIRLRSMFQMESSPKPTLPVLVLSSERGRTGLVVDRIHGQREVVVSAIRDPLIQVRGIAGATEMGDGRPVLILDAGALTGGIVRPHDSEIIPTNTPAALSISI